MKIRRWFITLLTVALAAGFTGGAMAGPSKDPGGGGGKSCNSGNGNGSETDPASDCDPGNSGDNNGGD
jgi:hypothetical protein